MRMDSPEKIVRKLYRVGLLEADDVDALARAKTQGDLSLILRSYADASGPSGRVGSPSSLDLGDVVRVYRSDQVTEVRVAR